MDEYSKGLFELRSFIIFPHLFPIYLKFTVLVISSGVRVVHRYKYRTVSMDNGRLVACVSQLLSALQLCHITLNHAETDITYMKQGDWPGNASS